MARPQQYDVFRPAALPSASLGKRNLAAAAAGTAALGEKLDSTSELDKVYNDWNTRIDKEVQAVAGGLRELVALADIGEDPTPNTHTLTAFHLKLKTSSLIRAAQTLRDTAHELRLALALGDDIASAGRRDAEAVAARAEVAKLRAEVAKEVGLLVGRGEGGEDEGAAAGDGGDGSGAAAGVAGGSGARDGGSGGSAQDGEKTGSTTAPEQPDEGMDVDADDDDDEDEFEEV